jgi:holo-[acyl-carrier protein] synthase
MILGIGNDLVDIRRIEKVLARYGERFILRCFTDIERATAAERVTKAATLAKRFAAKEACAKALGIGLGQNLSFRDMGVVNLPTGQPTLELTGGALTRLEEITPPFAQARLHLTITDEAPWAQAFVVIEAVTDKPRP